METKVSRLDSIASNCKVNLASSEGNTPSRHPEGAIKPTDLKVCNVCGIEKPITEFYKHPTTKDGYKSKCKICYNGKIYRPKAKKIKKKLNKNEKYCLKCEEVFISEGMFNRICPSCKKINAGMYVSEFE